MYIIRWYWSYLVIYIYIVYNTFSMISRRHRPLFLTIHTHIFVINIVVYNTIQRFCQILSVHIIQWCYINCHIRNLMSPVLMPATRHVLTVVCCTFYFVHLLLMAFFFKRHFPWNHEHNFAKTWSDFFSSCRQLWYFPLCMNYLEHCIFNNRSLKDFLVQLCSFFRSNEHHGPWSWRQTEKLKTIFRTYIVGVYTYYQIRIL